MQQKLVLSLSLLGAPASTQSPGLGWQPHGGTEPTVSLDPMISSLDPGNSASQNKHHRAANRQLRNKTALRWGSGQNQPSLLLLLLRRRPPSSRAARPRLCSAQRGSAAAKPRQHVLPVASTGSGLRSPPGLCQISRFRGTPSGRSRVARASGWGHKELGPRG